MPRGEMRLGRRMLREGIRLMNHLAVPEAYLMVTDASRVRVPAVTTTAVRSL